MKKQPISQPINQSLPQLRISRKDAEEKIKDRINRSKEFLDRQSHTLEHLEAIRRDYSNWAEYNFELLKRIFSNDSLAQEYMGFGLFGGVIRYAHRDETLSEKEKDLKNYINANLRRLESIQERLELIPVELNIPDKAQGHNINILNKKVFIVHGHDEGAREAVARFLDKLNINAIILHEQASGGRTVIEKLEHNSDVDFAIVLLTPDDVGAVATKKDNLRPRARQNVVLELGYFIGLLKRNRLCILYKGSVELPSDCLGVVSVPMDERGGWRHLLTNELREAGFSIDLNDAL